MDYIKLKNDVAEMEKHANDWKRKIEILGMEEKRTKQVLRSVTGVTASKSVGGVSTGAGSSRR
jgi:hypothetical protein